MSNHIQPGSHPICEPLPGGLTVISKPEHVSGSSRGNAVPILRKDEELLIVIERCQLKAEACHWMVEKRGLLSQGVDVGNDISHRERELRRRAHELPDCDPWMFRSNRDTSLLETAGGNFEALGHAISVAQIIHSQPSTDKHLRADSFQLVAEAQSALRVAIQRVNGPSDFDQVSAYHWVRDNARRLRIFVERHLRRDDPADPGRWRDLNTRIRSLRERLDRDLRLKHRRSQLLGALRYELVEASATDLSPGHVEWEAVSKTIQELIETGMPPSNVELREILLPHIQELPQFDEASQGYRLAIRETRRYLKRCNADDQVAAEPAVTVEVAKVAKLLKGKSVVLIGGDHRPHTKESFETAFQLRELVWVETKPGQSVHTFVPHIARPEVALVLLGIRWASHGFGNANHICDRYEKPLVRLPYGYGVNQVATRILGQCGKRLREQFAGTE